MYTKVLEQPRYFDGYVVLVQVYDTLGFDTWLRSGLTLTDQQHHNTWEAKVLPNKK